jgi:hypothetical protein
MIKPAYLPAGSRQDPGSQAENPGPVSIAVPPQNASSRALALPMAAAHSSAARLEIMLPTRYGQMGRQARRQSSG